MRKESRAPPPLGGDPHWALYHQRERLAYTDPPSTPPQPHHTGGRGGKPAVLAALAIVAVLRADTTPIATTAAINQPGPPQRNRRPADPYQHMKEALP